MNILLKNTTIIDQNSSFHKQKKDVLIENGNISKIAGNISPPAKCKVVEKENLHISTGWFDTSVCFGEPGFEERETIDHGLTVAAKSGLTAVAVNPNTHPKIDSKAGVEFMIYKQQKHATQLYPIANLTQSNSSNEMAELFDMQQSGAIAFGNYNESIENENLLKVALQYAQSFNGLILSFPQNENISKHGMVNESENTVKLGLKGIPTMAEAIQIERDLSILEYAGGKLHIPTISTEKSVQLIKEAKKKGLDITCSVAAHHLVLTDSALHDFDTRFKITPPLRTKKDVAALIKGVKDGTIDMITSDHNPINIENKKVAFNSADCGTIGLESLFGAVQNVVGLENFVTCLTTNPRKRFGIQTFRIEKDAAANITLFNPNENYTFAQSHILSTSKNAAFLNHEMRGKVIGIHANNKLILN